MAATFTVPAYAAKPGGIVFQNPSCSSSSTPTGGTTLYCDQVITDRELAIDDADVRNAVKAAAVRKVTERVDLLLSDGRLNCTLSRSGGVLEEERDILAAGAAGDALRMQWDWHTGDPRYMESASQIVHTVCGAGVKERAPVPPPTPHRGIGALVKFDGGAYAPIDHKDWENLPPFGSLLGQDWVRSALSATTSHNALGLVNHFDTILYGYGDSLESAGQLMRYGAAAIEMTDLPGFTDAGDHGRCYRTAEILPDSLAVPGARPGIEKVQAVRFHCEKDVYGPFVPLHSFGYGFLDYDQKNVDHPYAPVDRLPITIPVGSPNPIDVRREILRMMVESSTHAKTDPITGVRGFAVRFYTWDNLSQGGADTAFYDINDLINTWDTLSGLGDIYSCHSISGLPVSTEWHYPGWESPWYLNQNEIQGMACAKR